MFIRKFPTLRDILLLAFFCSILFGFALGSFPLEAPDGARYAEIPREMVVSGDYVTPHLNCVKYFEKPPLFYWMQAGSIKVFGVNDWSVRAPNALLGVLTCLLVYGAGRTLFGRKNGLFAGFALATSLLFFCLTQVATLDLAFTFFLTAALFSFILGARASPATKSRFCYFLVFYFCAALATLTKGLIGIIFPGAIIFFWILFLNRWRELKSYYLVSGSLLFLLAALPWHILVQMRNHEFFHFYFIEQHFLRYFTEYSGRVQPTWFFPTVFLAGFFPWTFFLCGALKEHLKNCREFWHFKATEVFLLLWPSFIFVFYLFSKSQLIPYLLPILPPLALLIGNFLVEHSDKNKDKNLAPIFLSLSVFSVLLGVFLLGAIKFINWQHQDFQPHHLLVVGVLTILLGVVSYSAYRWRNGSFAVITLIVTTTLLLASLKPILNVSNHNSIKPVIDVLRPLVKPDDVVISYFDYYQDLPFYLERCVPVVNFRGELDFGMKQEKTPTIAFPAENFWQLWNSKTKRVFAVADQSTRQEFIANSKFSNYCVLASHFDAILIINEQCR